MLRNEVIAEWEATHPWNRAVQVEQDLLLEGILHKAVEVAGADDLAFIGGTCLHKLYGPQPQRYSEDLDFAWMGDLPVDDTLAEIAENCVDLGFERIDIAGSDEATFPKVLFFYTKTDGTSGKIKLETSRRQPQQSWDFLEERTFSTESSWLTTTSSVQCASLPALAGMKVVAGSIRGKSRDLYDLDYMLNDLGVSRNEAMEWARRLQPSDWKPSRRHRFVKRAVRRTAYWEDMNDYLPVGQTITECDSKRMSSVMLGILEAIQNRVG